MAPLHPFFCTCFVQLKPNHQSAQEVDVWTEMILSFMFYICVVSLFPDGNQCQSNMCVHGDCVDMYQAYACRCKHGYEGKNCDQRESVCQSVFSLTTQPHFPERKKSISCCVYMLSVIPPAQTATNCSIDNGNCDHGCTESENGLRRTCSCVDGYKLHDNARTCVPKGKSMRIG